MGHHPRLEPDDHPRVFLHRPLPHLCRRRWLHLRPPPTSRPRLCPWGGSCCRGYGSRRGPRPREGPGERLRGQRRLGRRRRGQNRVHRAGGRCGGVQGLARVGRDGGGLEDDEAGHACAERALDAAPPAQVDAVLVAPVDADVGAVPVQRVGAVGRAARDVAGARVAAVVPEPCRRRGCGAGVGCGRGEARGGGAVIGERV